MKKERNVNAYSSDGRIYQLEYAMKAASLGTTTIGLRVKDGVVVTSEKKIVTPLQIPESVKKHHKVFNHCGFAFSGLSGDARTIIKKARENAVEHEFLFNEKIPIEGIVKSLAEISLNFGEKEEYMKIFSRPFGISVLIGGYDTEARLFSLDPSGTYVEYSAKAIGSAAEAVTTEMKNVYRNNMSIEEAVHASLSLLKGVMKDPINQTNCEVMICSSTGVSFLSSEEIEAQLAKLG
ncbi:20S proteasome subunit alpha 5 [Nematocida sp. AWRm77]|nr:20S proteasome subunit alpha 5 [Nematocida sp. AWRm77]